MFIETVVLADAARGAGIEFDDATFGSLLQESVNGSPMYEGSIDKLIEYYAEKGLTKEETLAYQRDRLSAVQFLEQTVDVEDPTQDEIVERFKNV